MAETPHKQDTRKEQAAPKPPGKGKQRRGSVQHLLAHGRYAAVIALVVIYGIGFFLRFEDLPKWRDNPDLFFFNGAPLLVNGDGYYYLRLARDLSEGKYKGPDEKRWYPDRPPRPSPPPLLSVITNVLHKIFRASLDWIAVLLPVLLAPLLALPVYGLARVAGGGRIMALAAALMCIASEYYVGRTRIGWFDTDCLIVTLTAGICYFSWRFACDASPRRYLYAAAAAAGFGVFLWWWDTAPEAVSGICIAMFLLTVLFFYRPPRREGYVFAASTAGVVLLLMLWRGFDAPFAVARNLLGRLIFVAGKETGPFPSTIGDVMELKVLGFTQAAGLVGGHAVLFVPALAGFVWLLASLRKRALLFAVLTLLAVLPFRFGNRFLVFQVPVVALGLGFLVERIWHLRLRWRPLAGAAAVVALLPPALCIAHCLPKIYRPPIARSMNAIRAVMDNTPAQAVMWTTWWHGYPIQYYTRLATVTDGGALQGRRLLYQNLPLAASNPRLAANFMQFWIGRGSAGMEKLYDLLEGDYAAALGLTKLVCAAGPQAARTKIDEFLSAGSLPRSAGLQTADDWIRFFFPSKEPPIYLLLTQDLTEAMEWFRRGTWDPAERRGKDAFFRRYYGIRRIDGTLRNDEGLFVDAGKGTVRFTGDGGNPEVHPLRQLLTFTGRKIELEKYENEDGMYFEWIQPLGFGAVMNRAVAESMFNNLFIRHRTFPPYFRQVELRSPYFQLWEVTGDSPP